MTTSLFILLLGHFLHGRGLHDTDCFLDLRCSFCNSSCGNKETERLLEHWRGVPFSLEWLVADCNPSRGGTGSCKCFAHRGRKRPLHSLSTQGYVQRHCFQFNPPPCFPFQLCVFSLSGSRFSIYLSLCADTLHYSNSHISICSLAIMSFMNLSFELLHINLPEHVYCTLQYLQVYTRCIQNQIEKCE